MLIDERFFMDEDRKVVKEERYDMIMDSIISMISNGRMNDEGKLLSENQLAKKLNVSRAHIREVYSALNIFGVVESRHGEGTFFKHNDSNMAYKLLFIMLFQGIVTVDEIMELRGIIEIGVSEKAAKNRTHKDVNDLRECISKMENCNDVEQLSMLDSQFHSIIGRSCGNPLLVGLSNIISGIVIKSIKEHWNYIIFDKNRSIKRQTFEQHRELAESIINKRPYMAKVIAQEHLEFVSESLRRYRQNDFKNR